MYDKYGVDPNFSGVSFSIRPAVNLSTVEAIQVSIVIIGTHVFKKEFSLFSCVEIGLFKVWPWESSFAAGVEQRDAQNQEPNFHVSLTKMTVRCS